MADITLQTTQDKALELSQEYAQATTSSTTVVNPKASNFANTYGLAGLKSVLGID